MLGYLAEEGLGFVGMAVAFMSGAVAFGLIFSAMDSIGQSAVDNTINRIR
tara:strand:- start:4576 stop:4725 length:150 start_codon:yes stop_codon:yes gene_type:complete